MQPSVALAGLGFSPAAALGLGYTFVDLAARALCVVVAAWVAATFLQVAYVDDQGVPCSLDSLGF